MNDIQTVLIDIINELKYDKDKTLRPVMSLSVPLLNLPRIPRVHRSIIYYYSVFLERLTKTTKHSSDDSQHPTRVTKHLENKRDLRFTLICEFYLNICECKKQCLHHTVKNTIRNLFTTNCKLEHLSSDTYVYQ
jgi:hypothetical protein